MSETYSIEDCDAYFVTSQINNWSTVTKGGDSFKISSYSVGLFDYVVEFKNTNSVAIALGDKDSWTWSCNNGLYDNEFNYHMSNGTVGGDNGIFTSTNTVYQVRVQGTTINVYQGDTQLASHSNCNMNYPKTIRIYPSSNSGNIEYIKVKPL